MKQYAIIVSGGSGQRMGSSIPKQFLAIHNEIILMKSIKAFYLFNSSIQIIVALPESQIDYWGSLCKKHHFELVHSIVKGGQTRFHSVKNALETIGDEGIVAVHDAVRPFVSQATIKQIFETALKRGNAIPFIEINDSIRYVDDVSSIPVDRSKYKLIQTPQAFNSKLIKEAYQQEWDNLFTDDASVLEKLGVKINLVKGNPENIKITTKTDLAIAEALSNYVLE